MSNQYAEAAGEIILQQFFLIVDGVSTVHSFMWENFGIFYLLSQMVLIFYIVEEVGRWPVEAGGEEENE